MLTIKHQHLSINAGIDYSNADGQAVLLPRDPQASATRIWTFLRSELQLKSLGVVIIDSVPFPLKWGQTARSLAHCGFIGLDDLTGQPDVFGRTLEMTKMSLVEGVAAAAHLEMGEAAEQTPVAVVTNVSRLQFQDRPPSLAELSQLSISTEDDAFAPLLSTSKWKQGGGGINL